jgi:3-hydroxybutyryl-CoA dehydrogenase
MPASIHTVAVIGAGTMGQGIAQLCASRGLQVYLYDTTPAILTQGIEKIAKSLEMLEQKGKLGSGERALIMSRIHSLPDMMEFKVDLVIEAVIEDLAIKQEIFSRLEETVGEDCILATNTSSLGVSDIGRNLRYRGRYAGLHFFNPPTLMRLVEVVKDDHTDSETVELLLSFCKQLDKEPVLVQDSPGFIVNRVARLYYVEALKLLEEGAADIPAIDSLMRAAGFKMGPFELMDLIGIDTNLAVTRSLYEAFREEPRFKPSRAQEQRVAEGHLGRKTGKGFYSYEKE